VPSCEFPANIGPWIQLRRFGVEVDMVPHRRGIVTVDDIEAVLTPRTRLVAVSWVQYLSGYRIDLSGLVEVAHANGSLVSVDATQGLGALQLDAEASGIDFLAAGAQKWLLGLQGAAIVYVTPALQERLAPIRGWLNGPMVVGEEMVIGDTLHPDARRFRVTAHPMASVVALDAALAMLHDAGPAAVEEAVLAVARRLAAGLDAAGFRRYGPDEVLSGIVTIDHEDAAGAQARLRDRRIRVSMRDRRLRFSPHAYNTADEADAVVAALVDG
jgi:selenocysteine lyase/cysteine desulfurase